jgi:hypothetical protein
MKRRVVRWCVAAACAMGVASALEAAESGEARSLAIHAAQGMVGVAAERAGWGESAVGEAKQEAGRRAWGTVYKTLMSPRCMNCHPAGDAPLQTDASRPHAMNISRLSERNGLACSTCHQTKNSEALGIKGGPPGAPNWHLPSAQMPLIFEGRSARELCEQLKRPADNGHKSLGALLEHVSHDPLVLWGWSPGGARTVPPVPHAEFVAAFTVWVESRGACP